MADPVVIGEGKIRTEHGDRMGLVGALSLRHRNRRSHGSLGWLLRRTRNTGLTGAHLAPVRETAPLEAPPAGNLCRQVHQGSGMLAVCGSCWRRMASFST